MTALITGGSGQDGSYLAERLRALGAPVLAPSRAALDVRDAAAVERYLLEHKPQRIFHLAAYHRASEAGAADDDDDRIFDVSLGGARAILRAVRRHLPASRVFLAGSAHVFGGSAERPQRESTPFAPTHPYGIAKAAMLQLGAYYRARGLFVVGGILYNHESPRRGPAFVTQRIATAAAEIAAGASRELVLGDLEARVDWGYAPEYVEAMRLSLEAPRADDYVIASGVSHSVRDFARAAFAAVGLDHRDHVREDPSVHARVGRADYLGDPSKIAAALGWRATTTLAELARIMVAARAPREVKS